MTSKREYDRQRRAEQPWRKWYQQKAWLSIRKRELRERPLCERCMKLNLVVAAKHVHHTIRHGGNRPLFLTGPFECLCDSCHNADAQQEERLGYTQEIGNDGWPVDPNHPANR